MFKENFFLFQSDDRAWADKIRKKDGDAKRSLEIKLDKGKKEHPGPKTIVYNPPEPEVPPPPGTTRIDTSVEMPVPYKDD